MRGEDGLIEAVSKRNSLLCTLERITHWQSVPDVEEFRRQGRGRGLGTMR